MSRLRLKQSSGWFVADDSFRQALDRLSDGAFKLFALLCLEAERPSGRVTFRQTELARKLGKSRRSVGTYLKDLQEKGICQVDSGVNQHDTNILQISPRYWPYETESGENPEASSQESQYCREIEKFYSSRPCVRFSLSPADRVLIRKWFLQSIDLSDVEQAVLLGCGRKYVSWLNGQKGEPIGSLYYFEPILKEVLNSQLSPGYRRFNRIQVDRLEKRWLKQDDQKSACAKISQPNPSIERRDEMMLTV